MSSTTALAAPDAAFLAERRAGIGGSDLAHVLGERPYGCPRLLGYRKAGVEPDYLESGAGALLRGVRLEALAVEEYEAATGRKVRRMGVRRRADRPWAMVHADRQILNDERGPGVLEVKTANARVFSDFRREGLHAGYIAQLQWGLYVTGYQWGAFAVLQPDTWAFAQFEATRDEALIAALAERAAAWWERHERGELVPQLADAGDRRCLSCVYRRTCRGRQIADDLPQEEGMGIEIACDESLAEIAADYLEARERREEDEATEGAIAERIKLALADRGAVDVPSVGVRFYYRAQKSSRVDTAALKKRYPDIAGELTKESVSRPFKFYRI